MAGVTPEGFVRKTEEECIAEIVAECRATVDPDFSDSPDAVTGQIVGIVAAKWAESYEVLEAVYGSLSDQSSGIQLDRVAALTNTFRLSGEADAAFRARRLQEVAAESATTEAGMTAALMHVTGMLDARAVSNRTMATDAAGRPPKSVEPITLGTATEADIVSAVWSKLPAGIEAYGTTPTSITDEEGNAQPLGYSRATAAEWYIRLTVEVTESAYAGSAVLAERVRGYSAGEVQIELVDGTYIPSGVSIGGILWRSRFSAAASTVAGVTGVTRVEFSADGVAWQDADLALPPRGYLGWVDTDNGNAIVRGFRIERVLVATT